MTGAPKGGASDEDGGGLLPFARILVTGADGFVGGYLMRALRSRLAPDTVVHTASRSPERAGMVAFDLEDPASIDNAVRIVRPDLVLHLAAQSSVGQSIDGGARTWSVNMGGSLALALAVARHCPDCTLFYTSSAEVYGSSFNDGMATETTPLAPRSAYSRSKAATEAMFDDVLPVQTRLLVMRPSNHIGPGQDDRFVVPAFASQIVRIERGEQPPTISVGSLDAYRDFMDVEDVVAGYLALLLRARNMPPRNIFNIASGDCITIASILDRLLALSSARITVATDPARLRPSEILVAAVDSSAFRAATGWRPRHALPETLGMIVDHLRLN